MVSYRDNRGVEHAVEVTAESLYEAAALGFEAIATDELGTERPGIQTIVEVSVYPPSVTHRVRIDQLQKWASESSIGPKERLLKQRLKERLGK